MGEVEVFMQRRFRCPHCRRSWATKRTAEQHADSCWRDPAQRTCLTCRHHQRAESGYCDARPGCHCQDIEESCAVDAALVTPEGQYLVSVDCTAWTPDGATP